MVKTPGNSMALDTGQVVFQFNAPNTQVDGLTWDGTNLWLSCDALSRIWKIDTLGSVLDFIPSPGPLPTGLTWDGQYLWCADCYTFFIYKLDPATGSIIDSIPCPGTGNSCEGLAWMNDTLWNTNFVNNFIWELDPATGDVWDKFPAPNGSSTGLAWDWHDNCLWNSDQTSSLIYKLDPATGTVITSFAQPGGAGTYVQDLAFDGTYLWTCTYDQAIVYKIDIGYVGVEEHKSSQPMSIVLQVSPNPFTTKTDIKWTMGDERLQTETFSLKIYDTSGHLVKNLSLSSAYSLASNKVSWYGFDNTGQQLPSGVYFLKVQAEDYSTTEKLLLIK